jgi:hypothetical protein
MLAVLSKFRIILFRVLQRSRMNACFSFFWKEQFNEGQENASTSPFSLNYVMILRELNLFIKFIIKEGKSYETVLYEKASHHAAVILTRFFHCCGYAFDHGCELL